MRRRIRFLGSLIIVFFVVLTGCLVPDKENQPAEPGHSAQGSTLPDHEQVQLTLWSYYGGWEPAVEQFERKYPDVTMKVEVFSHDVYKDKYLQALADRTPPDLMMIDSTHFGDFTAIDGLENLLQEPYNAGAYKQDFSKSLWETGLSSDRQSLIGFPIATSPSVTYYRADMLEQYGFPSDPELLGSYMENPDNWLGMAKTLQEHDKFITLGGKDVLDMYGRTEGLFDEQYRFQRNTAKFTKALDIAEQVDKQGLGVGVDLWQLQGQKAIADNRIVMLYLGSWGASQIEDWVPEQSGKWRAARLPFNLYGWQNSSSFALPSLSKHKELAWKFIEFAVTEYSMGGLGDTVPAFLPARSSAAMAAENEFLGGQQARALYAELANNMNEHALTPLDRNAQELWDMTIGEEIGKSYASPKSILDDVEQRLHSRLDNDIQILLQGSK